MNATTASGATVIELENISKVFYADSLQTNALSEVNLVINRGEFVSITGPSGCGKSTLMAILGILDAPTSGRYLFDGNDLAGVSVAEAAHIRCREIGFVFQSFNLIGDLTVLENIVVPLTYRDDIGKRQYEELAMAALDKVGLTHRARHYPAQLSGGQQQRVAIARALVQETPLILADEPTGALDSTTGKEVMEILTNLHRQEGRTIVIITHDHAVSQLCERIISIKDGYIVNNSSKEV